MMNLSSLSKIKILVFTSIVFLVISIIAGMSAPPSYKAIASFFPIIAVLPLLAIFYFQRKITNEVKRSTQICKLIGEGDFNARIISINESGELKDLQWSINQMTDSLDAFVRESAAVMECVSRNQYYRRILEGGMQGSLLNGARIINKATENVAQKMNDFVTVANDLDDSLKEVVKDINATTGNLSEVATSMGDTVVMTREGSDMAVSKSDDTSANVQAISAAAEEMSSCIAEISQQVSRTSDMARDAVEETQESQKIVSALSESADKIGEVIELIEKIAEQTNLLALNATIEAARAGDAGKGFAVVASEVKGLAGQTAKATEEIGSHIAGIQQATKTAVESFTNIGKKIELINEGATAVAAAVEQQNAASKEIASGATRASEGTTYVAGNVKEIRSSIGQVDEAANKVLKVTGDLSQNVGQKVEILLNKMEGFMDSLKKIA